MFKHLVVYIPKSLTGWKEKENKLASTYRSLNCVNVSSALHQVA